MPRTAGDHIVVGHNQWYESRAAATPWLEVRLGFMVLGCHQYPKVGLVASFGFRRSDPPFSVSIPHFSIHPVTVNVWSTSLRLAAIDESGCSYRQHWPSPRARYCQGLPRADETQLDRACPLASRARARDRHWPVAPEPQPSRVHPADDEGGGSGGRRPGVPLRRRTAGPHRTRAAGGPCAIPCATLAGSATLADPGW